MEPKEIIAWLNTLSGNNIVCVDEGGLCLVEIDDKGKPTGAYLEVGGEPML